MPISQKIIDSVESMATSSEEKILMMKILKIEDDGVYRFEAAYEKAIKEFIAKQDKGVAD